MTIGNVLNYYLPFIEYIIIEDRKAGITTKFDADEIDDNTEDLRITGFKPYKDGLWFILSMS